MDYKGDLYGRAGGIYFKLGKTADDWDKMEARIDELEAKISEAGNKSKARGDVCKYFEHWRTCESWVKNKRCDPNCKYHSKSKS